MLKRQWCLLLVVVLCGCVGCSRRVPPTSEPAHDGVVAAEPTQEGRTEEAPAEASHLSDASDARPEEPTPEPPPEREPPVERELPQDIPPVPKYPTDGLQGTVVHVTDGDTLYLVMQPGGWASRVRLKGVNAPECYKKSVPGSSFQSCTSDKDYYGLQAYQTLNDLFSGAARRVTIACTMKGDRCEEDEFGRFLAYLKLPDGRDAGEALLRAGAVWAFTRYTNEKVAAYCRAEADSIRKKMGMWKQGRSYIKSRMSSSVRSWYYNHRPNHDSVCSDAMNQSFAKAAGE